jgi:branched-chain amino acid transport system permease protein
MQILVNGLVDGLLYGLMALGFSLVYSTTRIFHFALAGIYAMAPFLLWASLNAGVPLALALAISLGITAAIGILCEEVMHWPFERKGASGAVHLIASLGMLLVLGQIIVLAWGTRSRVLRPGIDRIVELGGIRLTASQLLGAAAATTAIGLFFVWLNRSRLGLELRAMADNPSLLTLQGRNVRRLRRIVFGGSAVLASVAALGRALDLGFDPHMGWHALLVGVVATIVGGTGSLGGAVLAGLAIGVVNSQVVWHLSGRWEEAVTLAILALVLFVRPQGLFGRKPRLEETR